MKKILGSALAALFLAGAVVAGGTANVPQQDNASVQSIGIVKTLGGNNNWPLGDDTNTSGTSKTAGNNNWPL
ncbi:hypothetical protein Q2T94_15210 [Paeniglutamicibacter sulfureus]|uniref:hypothetical protein n=1 Tax=Paeniglutamicibacter sulfureus TaxID=43666 RepID=UPI002665BBD0|nr:hypothetical protein [Paeniglutamicibacter sulfureus]MDO2935656.1 hypothetical protein [Paeniglutamicibacter sulfureus]